MIGGNRPNALPDRQFAQRMGDLAQHPDGERSLVYREPTQMCEHICPITSYFAAVDDGREHSSHAAGRALHPYMATD
ncbi:hypothetical protein [Kibdelosporangium persicum]|uniref:hypothetical protein n=1 Tax=Kibdelosporangium persicum TaxID=2698649 RepID=UPI0015642D08|nr:hypothetical protein [Kibdelosporangium persicum]